MVMKLLCCRGKESRRQQRSARQKATDAKRKQKTKQQQKTRQKQKQTNVLRWGVRDTGWLPCCIRDPMLNQSELSRVNWFSTTSESGLHGFGLYHSYGVNLSFSQHNLYETAPIVTFKQIRQAKRAKKLVPIQSCKINWKRWNLTRKTPLPPPNGHVLSCFFFFFCKWRVLPSSRQDTTNPLVGRNDISIVILSGGVQEQQFCRLVPLEAENVHLLRGKELSAQSEKKKKKPKNRHNHWCTTRKT